MYIIYIIYSYTYGIGLVQACMIFGSVLFVQLYKLFKYDKHNNTDQLMNTILKHYLLILTSCVLFFHQTKFPFNIHSDYV